ncbi:TPA: hypothetical protein I7730_00400 [Vibrio vulnificus]|uniref:Uncharacterized protein n=1 Tax=Vibrio vulnificus TaxID=672 RepID=A0A8H9MYM3_VIBVL|nr:hypothetical protein [Vibrio vulnificus]HAS8538259.1 hypothetical protein [Vibrio vulnificus]
MLKTNYPSPKLAVEQLADTHLEVLSQHKGAHIEIFAYRNHKGYTAHLNTADIDVDSNRTVIQKGIGELPNKAIANLLIKSGLKPLESLPEIDELAELYNQAVVAIPYLHFVLRVNSKLGWDMTIEINNDIMHPQYECLVHVSTDNPIDTFKQSVAEFKANPHLINAIAKAQQ